MPPKFDKADQILEELRLLNAKVDGVDGKLEALNNTVKGLRTDVDRNSISIAAIQDDLNTYKETTNADILAIKTSFNRREQQLRSCTVRIFNFQVSPGESVDNYKGLGVRVYDRLIQPALAAAVQGGDLAKILAQSASIEACFRAFSPSEPAPGDPPAPVICRLSSRHVKFCLMKYRREVTATAGGGGPPRPKRIVIVEDLTPPAYSLLKGLQAHSRVNKVWSTNGQIYFTCDGQATVIKAKNIFASVADCLPPPPPPSS